MRTDLSEVQARTVRGSIWGMIAVFAGLPITILTTVILARTFGPERFGQYALFAFLVPTIIGLTDLGLTNGFIQRGATAFGKGDTGTLERTAGRALTWAFVRWPVIFGSVGLIMHDSLATLFLGIASAAGLLYGGASLALFCTVRNAELQRVSLLANTASGLAMIALAATNAKPSQVVTGGLAALNLTSTLQVAYLRGSPGLLRACFRPRSLSGVRDDLAFGGLTFLSWQLASLMLSRSELLFFSAHQSLARGVYGAAYTLGSRVTLPLDAIYNSVGASVSAVSDDDEVSARTALRLLRVSGSLFTVAAGPSLLVMVLSAGVLFPPKYVGVVPAAVIMGATSIGVSAVNPLLALYFAARRVRPLLRSAVIALAVNVGLCFVLVSSDGLSGAVAANALSATLYIALLAVPMLRTGSLRDASRRYWLVVAGSLAVATASGLLVADLSDPLARVILAALLGVAQPAAMLWLLPSMDETDVEVLNRHLPAPLRTLFAPIGALARVRAPRRSPNTSINDTDQR